MERWQINLYTLWVSQVLSLTSFNLGIPFIPFFIQELSINDPDKINLYTGILSMAPALTMALMAPIWGILADRVGKKPMLLRAMGVAALVLAGMGLVANVHQLVVLRFIQGLFTGTITASAALVATATPEHRLSSALGFMSSSTFVGISLGPVIGGFLAEYAGYRVSFYAGGILMALDFLLVLLLVKEEKTVSSLPSTEKKSGGSFLSIFPPSILIMLVILFILRFSRSLFAPYLPLFVQQLRSGLGGAAKLTGIINGATGIVTALSGVTLSRLGDSYERMALIKVLLVMCIIVSTPLFFLNNLVLFTVIYCCFFFVIGGIEPVVLSFTVQSTPQERRGTLFGMQDMIGNMGWVVSPLVASAISIQFSLQMILLLIPLSLLIGVATVFMLNKFHPSQRHLPM